MSLYPSPTIVLNVSKETEYIMHEVFVITFNVLTLSTMRHLSPKQFPLWSLLIILPCEVHSTSPSFIIYKQAPGSPSILRLN